MSMHALRLVSIVLFWALVCPAGVGNAGGAAAPLRAWDEIVSPTIFSDIADFQRDIREDKGERIYTFLSRGQKGELALSVAAAIAPAESRLPAADWQAAVVSADPATRKRDFPEIGVRARTEAPRFAPAGALSGVVFTTGDGFFDVAVSVFEASGTVERPLLTAREVARRIAAAYDDSGN